MVNIISKDNKQDINAVYARIAGIKMESSGFEEHLRNIINTTPFSYYIDTFHFCIKASIAPSRKISWIIPPSKALSLL